jgi:hypothetical protein
VRVEAEVAVERTLWTDRWLVATAVLLAVAATATVIGGPVFAIPLGVVIAGAVALARRPLANAMSRPAPSGAGPGSPWRHLVQTWWAPIATATAAIEVAMGVVVFFTGANWSGRIIGGLLVLPGFGFLTLYGLWMRPRARAIGNTCILVGTLPWFSVFWMVVPPLMGLLVWFGVFKSGFAEPEPIPPGRP